jgi:hypothetical protein
MDTFSAKELHGKYTRRILYYTQGVSDPGSICILKNCEGTKTRTCGASVVPESFVRGQSMNQLKHVCGTSGCLWVAIEIPDL